MKQTNNSYNDRLVAASLVTCLDCARAKMYTVRTPCRPFFDDNMAANGPKYPNLTVAQLDASNLSYDPQSFHFIFTNWLLFEVEKFQCSCLSKNNQILYFVVYHGSMDACEIDNICICKKSIFVREMHRSKCTYSFNMTYI